MSDHDRIRAAFRLNLEQQKKRAKELLQSAKRADPTALSRIAASKTGKTPPTANLKLADTQFVIARELGFSSWPDLKTHIASLDDARSSVARVGPAPDDDMKTLHLRCGSDIKQTLIEAGFGGDFLEHSYPYCHWPVTAAKDHLEREARFVAERAGKHMNTSFADALAWRQTQERQLAASANAYERIVLWMEHDCFDQLVLVRCLAHYATLTSRPLIELIGVNQFPGTIRFIGLGQLPAEALRLLWQRRQPVSNDMLATANTAWNALTSSDPRTLTNLMRSAHQPLPDLPFALRRLLQELPDARNGLSLTQRLILTELSKESLSLHHLFANLTYRLDPLPLMSDLELLCTLEDMRQLRDSVLTKTSSGKVWEDVLSITARGRQVLQGEVDYLSLQPPARWVGGVEVRSDGPVWRWDEHRNDVAVS